jgi:hypothetical protein
MSPPIVSNLVSFVSGKHLPTLASTRDERPIAALSATLHERPQPFETDQLSEITVNGCPNRSQCCSAHFCTRYFNAHLVTGYSITSNSSGFTSGLGRAIANRSLLSSNATYQHSLGIQSGFSQMRDLIRLRATI